MPPIALRPREDTGTAERLVGSALVSGDAAYTPTAEIREWMERRTRAHRFKVERIPFARLEGWSFGPGGDLAHRSGRFFSIRGLHVTARGGAEREWQQPIIMQPEIGVLGILAREFDGVLHFLMQAKMEPGNANVVQLSPTVQATRSNYTGAHGGSPVRYLEYFTEPRGRVVVDVLQSEHGAWFYHKCNRNMIIETREDVPLAPDFRWLTLGQLAELLRDDDLVNMDARTILACAPAPGGSRTAVLSDTELISWFTGEQSRHDVSVRRLPLDDVDGWTVGEWSIDHRDHRDFRVMAVRVEAASREVAHWTQPLLEPLGEPVAAFLVRRFHGVPHLLAHARMEGGLVKAVELAPTVQCTPGADHPPFLDAVLGAGSEAIRYNAVLSEEGGRLFHPRIRYMVIDTTGDQAPDAPPPGFQWVTPDQLNALVRHSHYVNVQARTLLAVLNSGAVEL